MKEEPKYRCNTEALTPEDNIGGASTVGGFRGVKEDALNAGTERRMRGNLSESFEAWSLSDMRRMVKVEVAMVDILLEKS
jgi:hypothetical protein